MTSPNYTKNAVVQGDDKIEFESRPEFGLEKKIEEETSFGEIPFPNRPRIKIEDEMSTENVNVKTEAEHLQLLQVLECADYTWPTTHQPTEQDFWNDYKEETYIEVQKFRRRIYFGSLESTPELKSLSLEEFYKENNITENQIKQVEAYFTKQNKQKIKIKK